MKIPFEYVSASLNSLPFSQREALLLFTLKEHSPELIHRALNHNNSIISQLKLRKQTKWLPPARQLRCLKLPLSIRRSNSLQTNCRSDPNSDDYHLLLSIVQQLFPEGKLDLSKKKIDWEIVAVQEGINKKAVEMRWNRFKKRNMEGGKWLAKEETNGGVFGKGDGGAGTEDDEAAPSKKRKKDQAIKQVQKDEKRVIEEEVDDGAKEDEVQMAEALVAMMTRQ